MILVTHKNSQDYSICVLYYPSIPMDSIDLFSLLPQHLPYPSFMYLENPTSGNAVDMNSTRRFSSFQFSFLFNPSLSQYQCQLSFAFPVFDSSSILILRMTSSLFCLLMISRLCFNIPILFPSITFLSLQSLFLNSFTLSRTVTVQ